MYTLADETHIDYLSTELISEYERLSLSLLNLAKQLHASVPKLWVPLPEDEESNYYAMLNRAIHSYLDLWYEGDQDGRETRSYPGLIGADEQLLKLATEVNQHKDRFQQVVQALQEQDSKAWKKLHDLLPEKNTHIRQLLSMSGIGRLHLKQIYRHIPILEKKPAKVGFSWYTSGKSIKRISTEEAARLLLQLSQESPHIQIQLDKLARISPKEPLARLQTLAPIVRANIVYQSEITNADEDTKRKKSITDNPAERKAMNVSLPIMFQLAKNTAFPNHNEISLIPPTERTRVRRSDIRIEDEPFLPSIRVFRYKQSD
jgi:hypothetical protein